MYIIMSASGNTINTSFYKDKEACRSAFEERIYNIEDYDGGETERIDDGTTHCTAFTTNTHSMFDYTTRMLPGESLFSGKISCDNVSADILIASVALASTLDAKLKIIADPVFDMLPDDEWQNALRILSVYLNMSVCDILAEIADRRPAPPEPDNECCCSNADVDIDDEMYEAMAEAYCADMENYDYPQPGGDNYFENSNGQTP